MDKITVNCTKNELYFKDKTYKCTIGNAGFTNDKQEGDNKTPLGEFQLIELWYRADKLDKPTTNLPTRKIEQDDGWCDDVNDDNYNKHIKLPYPANHEKLWRDDDIYDLIIVISHNREPIIKGTGSAIFIHLALPEYQGTEGCIALDRGDMLEILTKLEKGSSIKITA